MTKAIKIPKRFYVDHSERDLPTPSAISETAVHIAIDCDDPALPELLSDARHYASEGTDAEAWIIRAAKALIASVERQCLQAAA